MTCPRLLVPFDNFRSLISIELRYILDIPSQLTAGMSQVKCPQCKTIFEMDASGYSDIVNQVRNEEFSNELSSRIKDIEQSHATKVQLAEQKISAEKEKQILSLKNEIENIPSKIELAKNQAMSVLQEEIFAKDKQIQRLKNERDAAQNGTKLAVTEATNDLEKRIMVLKNEVQMTETKKELEIKQIEQSNQTILSTKDEIIRTKEQEIERIRDMKMKMSVKEIGEKLETWCQNQFNLVRATAFPYAYFEKDSKAMKDDEESKGTKGDFIFRDSDIHGTEFISIMFEMKDKMEGTKGQTNESHLSKLDKDRKKKNCEYAVLVSMLEPENDLYNSGPVDMSHKYEKMYVVRPQDFMMILSLIRNEARKSLEMRNELAIVKSQNIDYENFENKLLEFQQGFAKNYSTAEKYYEMAIKDIDDTIKKLEKIKKSLTTSGRQLRLANDKTQDLSIKKLTRGNPTMRAKFEEINSSDE